MEKSIDLIEKYLMNDMSFSEQKDFEESLKNDPKLMKEFKFRKEINEAIIEDNVIRLRNSLDDIVNETPVIRLRKNTCIYSAIAAVITLFVVVSSIYLRPSGRIDKNDLFQSYYIAYPAVVSFRSSEDYVNTEKSLYSAFNYYDDKKYEIASYYFKMQLEKHKSIYISQFYLSICEIEKNNLADAEKYLDDLILKKNHIFWEQSHWYLALVYLKQNKTSNAEGILKKIVQDDMSYKYQAENILKILN